MPQDDGPQDWASTWSRREFLRRMGGSAAGLALGSLPFDLAGVPLDGADPAKKPNILVVMSDEHNASVLGCGGNDLIRTPNLDALAARGVFFENHYCNSPLCVPSRLAFTSGKYVSRVGAWNNQCRLPTDAYPSLAHSLNAAGYESFLCGKMHYDATHRYGFTEIGRNMNGSKMDGRGNRLSPAILGRPHGLADRFEEFKTAGTSQPMRHDTAVVAGVRDFFATRKADAKPFFLAAGFLCPHFPLIVPESCWKNYADKVPMPRIPAGHLESQPLNYRVLRAAFQAEDVPAATVKFGRELYYGLTQWMDERVGEVLAALAKSPFADSTLVVYTSDHGENMGEHGLWWKSTMYEHAARVPLIISAPRRWPGGQRRRGASSMVDLTRTLVDVGGGKPGADWNGDSLVPWLDDASRKWKDLAVSEYYAHNIASGYTMIRMGRHKYVYHTPTDAGHPAERELYDLEEDPGEFDNLASKEQNKDLVSRLHAALVKEIGEDPDKTEIRCRADYAKGYVAPATGNGKPSQDPL